MQKFKAYRTFREDSSVSSRFVEMSVDELDAGDVASDDGQDGQGFKGLGGFGPSQTVISVATLGDHGDQTRVNELGKVTTCRRRRDASNESQLSSGPCAAIQ